MSDASEHLPRHPIGIVARRTGLSVPVLRAWERRHGVVEPGRTGGGHRLYSDQDLRHLALLARLTAAGRGIGSIADLSIGELERLVEEETRAVAPAGPPTSARPSRTGSVGLVEAALEAADALDDQGLRRVLHRAAVMQGVAALLDDVLFPLVTRIDAGATFGATGWVRQRLAEGSIRQFLLQLVEILQPPGAPVLVAATLEASPYELGSLMAAVVAAEAGWRPLFLGGDISADEVGAAVRRAAARAVVISATFWDDEPGTRGELERLLDALPDGLAWFANGASSARMVDRVGEAGGMSTQDLTELRIRLQGLRLRG